MIGKRAARGGRKALEHKVKLLERCARWSVNPDPSVKLKALKDVQQWRGRTRANRPARYQTWSSFTVASPGGPNSDLRTRLDDVLPKIAAIQSGNRPIAPKKPRRGQAVSEAQLKKEVERLVAQVEEMFEQLSKEEAAHKRTAQNLEIAQRQIAELRGQLSRLQPFRTIV